LRIAFDIADVWGGGAERVTLDVAAALSDLGHDVLFIVNKHVRHYAEYADRVDILELGRVSRWDVRVLPDIRRALQAFKTDVCVCVMFNASLWGRLAAASLGCPVVVAEHSTTGTVRTVERLTNIVLDNVTETVIACAANQVDSLILAGHRRRKIHVVRNGVDTRHFSRDAEGAKKMRAELSLPPDIPIVMLVAAHRPEKRHDRFLRLVEHLHSTGTRVGGVMVGGGPLLEDTKALAEASSVSDWVRVIGPVADMRAAYSTADVVVLLSDDIETFPLCFLEAQACEVPVVGMDTGGVRETFLEGESGFLIEQADLNAMGSTIAALLSDPSRRRQMGRTGRAYVEEHLSTEATLRGYLHALERSG